MARSPIKVPSENDVIPPAEETLDFDDDNLRGEQNRYYFVFFFRRAYFSDFRIFKDC